MQNSIQIEYIDPRELVPADYNPREIEPINRARLMDGLRHFGFVEPLVVRRSDSMIIGGHQRLDISLELVEAGIIESVPVVYGEWSDDEAKALNVLLNNPNAQGRFNLEMLAEMFDDMDASIRGLTGYDSEFIDTLIQEQAQAWNNIAPLAEDDALAALPNGERAPFEQVTFNLHDEQATRLRQALEIAKGRGEFDQSLNANSNGNALARIVDFYIESHGNSERHQDSAD